MLSRISPVWLVLGGILSVQFGAGVAKDLFDEISPTSMVWLRLVTSSLVLAALARPALRGRSREDWLVALGLGITLGAMNWSIYQSFARIPLGLAVTIEFIGPLTIAVIGSRRARDLVWVALAAAGVGLLGFGGGDLNVAGVLFALVAGAGWAAYILLSAQTGRRWPGLDGLAVASVIATVMLTPAAIAVGGGTLLDPRVLALGAAVGPAQLGHPVQLRDDRAAHDPTRGVQHPDEPRAGRRGAGRDHRPAGVPEPGRVARRGLRDRRERRRDPRDHRDRRAGPGLNPFPAEFTQTSHSVDQPDAPGS